MVRMQKGFTLVEAMIVCAIIGVLVAVAVPRYTQHTKRAKFTEIKMAAFQIKAAVEDCYQRNAGAAACRTPVATGSVPTVSGQPTEKMQDKAAGSAMVASVTLTDNSGNPVITVVPNPVEGFTAADEFILTGTHVDASASFSAHISVWNESGDGCDEGYC